MLKSGLRVLIDRVKEDNFFRAILIGPVNVLTY
jgi:hypothetical protein